MIAILNRVKLSSIMIVCVVAVK